MGACHFGSVVSKNDTQTTVARIKAATECSEEVGKKTKYITRNTAHA